MYRNNLDLIIPSNGPLSERSKEKMKSVRYTLCAVCLLASLLFLLWLAPSLTQQPWLRRFFGGYYRNAGFNALAALLDRPPREEAEA